MTGTLPTFFSLFLLSAALAALPMFLLMGTSYAKISIVLFLVRNALGVQQTPPTNVLGVIAVVLTLFVMAPVFREVYAIVANPQVSLQSIADFEQLTKAAFKPISSFLEIHTRPEARAFFMETTEKIWKDKNMGPVSENDVFILLPSFLVSELTRAFEIGFLLYLPFLVVDFVISVIIVAMGMNSLSPTVISTPLKLLLFISVDGWSRLLQGLVLSYVPAGS